MSVVTLAWVMMALAATPAVVVFIAKTVNRNFTIVDYQQYMAAVRWMDSSGLLDAVLCAAVIGWPLSIAWSAWAWNRRARRLSKAAELSTDVSVDTDVVWPPPPQ